MTSDWYISLIPYPYPFLYSRINIGSGNPISINTHIQLTTGTIVPVIEHKNPPNWDDNKNSKIGFTILISPQQPVSSDRHSLRKISIAHLQSKDK